MHVPDVCNFQAFAFDANRRKRARDVHAMCMLERWYVLNGCNRIIYIHQVMAIN